MGLDVLDIKTTTTPHRDKRSIEVHLCRALSLLFTFILILNWDNTARASELSEFIRGELELVHHNQRQFVEGISADETEFLLRLYENRKFAPFWVNDQQTQQLISFIASIEEEGLDPEDYHLKTLVEMTHQQVGEDLGDTKTMALIDILCTHSFARVAYHLSFGKVDPILLNPGWNFDRDISEVDPIDFIAAGIESGDVHAFLKQFIPKQPIYTFLKQALAEYRVLARAGGWEQINAGDTIKPGSDGPRVQQLRQRLKVTGDLAGGSIDSEHLDDALEQAVKTFQNRHGLTADGLVGRQTLHALNRPISARIDQIRINLERMRWFLHDIPDTFVVVDIAGFHVYLIGNEQAIWDTKAMVGTPYRKTPSFRSKIEYVVINPTWTIPPGILRKDTIPAIKEDPAYLEVKNISVLDRKGNVLDRDRIDWSQYGTGNFPFILRQEPGPNNALGLIKFIFPNPHFVFLHDTPSRNLFERTERAFSSGCIRVDQPFTLAEHLLKDPNQWNQETFQQIVDSGKTRTLFLNEPMAVLLLYLTAHAEEDGTVSFKRDIYGRDEKVLKALEGDFKLHKKLPLSS